MPKNLESKSIEQLMAEADELIQHINSESVNDMEETHRLEFEKHAQKFQKIKSEVQEKSDEKGTLETAAASADGMHEAIQDIVKAFQDLKNKIF
jgi:hypothetical protein